PSSNCCNACPPLMPGPPGWGEDASSCADLPVIRFPPACGSVRILAQAGAPVKSRAGRLSPGLRGPAGDYVIMRGMTTPRFYLLGPPHFAHGETPVDLPPAKAIALLAYLAQA